MLELETFFAFGVGAGLVALAPMVSRLGNPQLGDSMNHVGRSMAKGGIKVGVTVAGAAGKAARSVALHVAEAAESLGDLVAEARTELDIANEDAAVVDAPAVSKKSTTSRSKKQVTVTDVTIE